jgi:hypothetical protein
MLYFDVPALVTHAEVAELADALASGASGGNPMKVRVLSSAPFDSASPFGEASLMAGRVCYCGPLTASPFIEPNSSDTSTPLVEALSIENDDGIVV